MVKMEKIIPKKGSPLLGLETDMLIPKYIDLQNKNLKTVIALEDTSGIQDTIVLEMLTIDAVRLAKKILKKCTKKHIGIYDHVPFYQEI